MTYLWVSESALLDCYAKPRKAETEMSVLQSFLWCLKMRQTHAEVTQILNHTQSLGGKDRLKQPSIICGDDRYQE